MEPNSTLSPNLGSKTESRVLNFSVKTARSNTGTRSGIECNRYDFSKIGLR